MGPKFNSPEFLVINVCARVRGLPYSGEAYIAIALKFKFTSLDLGKFDISFHSLSSLMDSSAVILLMF